MAGEKADVRFFNFKQMENFRDNEVVPVRTAAKKHREQGDGHHIRPLAHLYDGHTTPEVPNKAHQVLRIGPMAVTDLVSGPILIANVTVAAKAIDKLLGDQMELFKEFQEALTETINSARKTKNENVDAIDAQTLLQTFDEVDSLTAGSTTTTAPT